jgi:DNA-binding MarR family transcriptional regulator
MPNIAGGMTTAERLAYLVELREPPRVRSGDPETAYAAAAAVEDNVTHLQRIVLDALLVAGDKGMTSQEISDYTKIDRVTISPRLRPLADKGLIVDSEERRPGNTGKMGIVWKTTHSR